ncbi:MAG TPA: DUF2062 domain-containing protein [Candidatus Deferrimicrobiaceae bacterium]|jgi:hypothetical protein
MIPIARIKAKLLAEIHAEAEEHAIAAGFAAGVFMSFTPFLFLHTAGAVLLALVFRWSKVAAIAGAWVNNPYTMPFVFYGCTWIGGRLLGVRIRGIRFESWDIKSIYFTAKPIVAPLLLGTTLLGLIAAGVAYFIVYRVAVRIKSAHRKAQSEPGGHP